MPGTTDSFPRMPTPFLEEPRRSRRRARKENAEFEPTRTHRIASALEQLRRNPTTAHRWICVEVSEPASRNVVSENLEMTRQDRNDRENAILFDRDENILVGPGWIEFDLPAKAIAGRPSLGETPPVEHRGYSQPFLGVERPYLHRRKSILWSKGAFHHV